MQQSVVFFGSGPVAARSLQLLSERFTIEAVVTKPRPVHHRGNFPVIDTAEELKLPMHVVSNRSELSNLISTRPFTSQLGILIDFGIIVGVDTIDYFPYGIVNSHFSVLPEWRGADPITFALLSGQPTTGVSLMMIDEGMDTGKILATKSIQIASDDTAASLTNKLILLSNTLLTEVVPRYLSGEIMPRQQSHPDRATYSRKLTKDDGIIDWSKSAAAIEREIRAFHEWPKSRTTLGSKDVIITSAHAVPGNDTTLQPGDIERELLSQGILMIETGNGRLCIDSLKPADKKEMPVTAFLAGYRQLL